MILISLALLSGCTGGGGSSPTSSDGSASSAVSSLAQIPSVPVGGEAHSVVYGFGAAWVQVDPRSTSSSGSTPIAGRVLMKIKTPDAYYVSAGSEAIWVIIARTALPGGPGLRGLDEDRDQRRGELTDLYATNDAVWVTDKVEGRVVRLDLRRTRSSRRSHRHRSPQENLNSPDRKSAYRRPDMKRLISLTSTQGKTTDQLVQEVMESYASYLAAEAKGSATPAGPPSEEDEPLDDDGQTATSPSPSA